jgi:biotin operon repressor
MAAHGNNKGENIWVSQQKIATYLGMKKRAAQKATKRLREAGVIKMTAESRQHKPRTYKINRGPRVT